MSAEIIELQKAQQRRFERMTELMLKTVQDPIQRKAIESLLKAYKLMGEAMRK